MQMKQEQQNYADKRIARAEKNAITVSNWCYTALIVILIVIALLLIAVFGIKCWREYIEGDAWAPYLLIEILGFIGVPTMLLNKGSRCRKYIGRFRDNIYSRLYSFFLQHD